MSTKPPPGSAPEVGPADGFDPGSAYRRSPSVALRPEPFGALVYHFGTRKLSFLKTPQLVDVVRNLERYPDVHSAIAAAGVEEAQRAAYLKAVAGLAASGTIEPRP
ncbi:mycofactocin biosynthesis chaperone MftB [Pseudonocardia asaccharolytica]|uniref:Mycofactocin system protein MftB n=1 Tax=Pseudonocardia asaccharolytica DSM 44247 = NBRC 16224 TaxID=1123024 RepID=A0A511CWV8_9PSEU|nr:mycofactocin biosynthesis chaperone MftB [Pseudonocardia asaccharolytica]GEL17046.1 mycofactocin system protein MftB [Pseudonocardia asaccharolytica DSM 44247 = NBRC 16224]